MKLKLVKQGDFLGTKCDFYEDETGNKYMSRTQIGYALGYSKPQEAIKKIHKKYKDRLDKFSVEVGWGQFGGDPINGICNTNTKAFMYSKHGIYEVCRKSKQPQADAFFDYVYSILDEVEENKGYVATEKDEKWLGVRQKSKLERRNFTDEIQEFVEYAKQHGSSKPEMYYKHFTKLVNDKLGIPKGSKRDDLSQSQLMDIMALERVITMKLPKLITDDMDYHDVYKQIKKLISII